MRRNILSKVGIIGNGNHSKRIQKILKKKNINYFIYKPKSKNYFNKEQYLELKKNKIIFIISPNRSHYKYIDDLHKGRYIFCEKQPVSSTQELNRIKKLNLDKVYFNFNFRFCKIANILTNRKKYNLGKLIYGEVVNAHGLAYKKSYVNSWRASKKKCSKGVFEIVSIHWVDILNFIFSIKDHKTQLMNTTKKGDSFDTSHTNVETKCGGKVNIFSTYASPLISKKLFIFTNGVVEQNDDKLEIRGPTENYNKMGNFIKPKLLKRIKIRENKDYIESIEKSISYFFNIAKKKKKFLKRETKCSLLSNHIILN